MGARPLPMGRAFPKIGPPLIAGLLAVQIGPAAEPFRRFLLGFLGTGRGRQHRPNQVEVHEMAREGTGRIRNLMQTVFPTC